MTVGICSDCEKWECSSKRGVKLYAKAMRAGASIEESERKGLM
jgi:hypothetical protein